MIRNVIIVILTLCVFLIVYLWSVKEYYKMDSMSKGTHILESEEDIYFLGQIIIDKKVTKADFEAILSSNGYSETVRLVQDTLFLHNHVLIFDSDGELRSISK